MKIFFKRFYLIFFLLLLHTDYTNTQAHADHISIQDMFKDVSQDDLFAMMTEGQQFIEYLEKHGTEEEKMAFAKAMEETLEKFTEEDWQALQEMSYVLEEKLTQEIEKEITTPEQKPQTIENKVNTAVVDNSLEKTLNIIHKTINTILLKVKGDKLLSERIAYKWDNRDDFNEMIRLLQVLNKKELITKITTSKEESDKLLLESIENFNKRLQIENDQFTIADTFGLQTDKKTTEENLKKLNIIIDFFDRGIASLLPNLIKFMQAYEPIALQVAEQHDKEAKNALNHATKVEKQKRNPNHNQTSSHNNNHHGNKSRRADSYIDNHNNSLYFPGNTTSSKQHPESYLQTVHKENISKITQLKKDASKTSESNTNKETKESDHTSKEKSDKKQTEYNKLINAIEIYFETFTDTDYGKKINAAHTIFQPFGKPINQADIKKAQQLEQKRTHADLSTEDTKFLQKHSELYQSALDAFQENTKKSLSIYEQMQTNIESITQSIHEMESVITKIKSSIDQLTLEELEKLNNSTLFRNLSNRIYMYHDQLKNIQHDLKTKHKLHRLEHQDPKVLNLYDSLEEKINSLHGLDRTINDLKSKIDLVHKSIKATISRSKRNENKRKATNTI